MELTNAIGDGDLVRRFEYEDRWVVAADLSTDADRVSVDTVGSTAIIVIEGGDRTAESELDLPGEATDVEVTNGILTIEVEK